LRGDLLDPGGDLCGVGHVHDGSGDGAGGELASEGFLGGGDVDGGSGAEVHVGSFFEAGHLSEVVNDVIWESYNPSTMARPMPLFLLGG
jgi:hypothetical protein